MRRCFRRWLVATVGVPLSLSAVTATAQLRARDPGSSEAQPDEQPPAAEPPTVTMPELREFFEAEYPPEAVKQSVEADVVLGLTIDAEGNVSAAEVVEPAGQGFDEAARQAALRFKFSPATRNGEPVPVRILYKYTFRLRRLEPAEAAPAAAPTTGALEGQIRLGDSDLPLAGTQVVITAPSGVQETVTTDSEGRFQVANLAPGAYRIRAEPSGFLPVESLEQVTPGEAVEVTYRVAPVMDQLEVTVRGERPPREVTRRTLTRQELRLIPGTGGDALAGLQSLPGVARSPGLSALLIVRGSSPQDTIVEVDGSEAPIIYHFGAFRSVIPTELLERIDFYPGGFSARYGRATGGIVDVGLREPDTECRRWGKPTGEQDCTHGVAQVDWIDGRVLLQGPLGGRWKFAVGGRRSWLDTWIGPVLEAAGAGVTVAPVYYDWQAIADHRSADGSKFSLRFYGADDRLKVVVEEPPSQNPGIGGEINVGTSSWRLQGLYETEIARGFDSVTMLSVGRNRIGLNFGDLKFDVLFYPIQARHEYGWTLLRGVKLNIGLDFVTQPASFVVKLPQPREPGSPDPGPFTSQPVLETEDTLTLFQPAWYGELEIQPSDRSRIIPSFRADYTTFASTADFSPRVNARYDLIAKGDEMSRPGRLRTTLKGGVGVYHKPPAPQFASEVFGTPGIGSERALHYGLGAEQQFTEHLELSMEGFYKDLSRLITSVPGAEGTEYRNQGTGSAIGLETLLQMRPGGSPFFGWLAYTLARSVRRNAPGEEEYPFQFDETHNLTALGSYDLGRGWTFGARFRLVSGRMETPVIRPPNLPALYAADAGTYTPLNGDPFSQRLPLVHQLDLRMEKAWQYEDWRLLAYMDVYNVYNNAPIEGLQYNYNFSEQVYASGLPIFPSLGVQGEF